MDLTSIAVVAGGLLLFSLVSGRLQGTIITAPLAFIVFGFAAGPAGLNVAQLDASHSVIHVIAELTLILVLFTDAARIDLNDVRRDHNLPQRMLLLGLPLTMLFGAAFAIGLFPDLTVWEAALLAALLAPTDAALGQAVLAAPAVPARIRQAINIESGLNDGIALPVVLMLAALAGSAMGEQQAGGWLQFAALQIGLGPLIGAAVCYVGARAIDQAVERGWCGEAFQGIAILALAVLTYVLADLLGGNGFIAAFVGGMVFGASIRNACTFLFEFMETEGQLLMLITFLIFGAALLPEALLHINAATLIYAALSLTVVRMVPIALALIGTGLSLPSKLFVGWFGPRGLASILFVLLILENADVPHREQLLSITVVTVALSALLHGISAAPLARVYGAFTQRMGECQENRAVSELPLRSGQTAAVKK